SKGRGNVHALSRKRKGKRIEQFAKPLDGQFNIFCAHVRNHDQKFVATEASAHIRNARQPPQSIRESAKNRVARFVPERVVNFLKRVNIAKHHPYWKAVARRAF